MPYSINPRKVARLQKRFLRRQGATPEEIRRYRPYLTAQIGAESNFQQGVGSSAGAQDIAQFMPATAESYGVTLGDRRIKDDIRGQVKYMLPLLRQHGVEGALRGYNAGPGAIEASKGYGETNAYVDRILSSVGDYRGMGGLGGSGTPRTRTTLGDLGNQTSPVGMDIFSTLAKLNQFTGPQDDPIQQQLNQGWQLLAQLSQDNGGVESPAASGGAGGLMGGLSAQGGGRRFRQVLKEANRIDKAKLPYQWGGGHGEKLDPNDPMVPLDCSGAVSRVLGINPMVSGQYESWGRPGRGKRVTIYANDEHVLMEINGHFWGTSSANPEGGAGWIPAKNVSPEYLSRFKARHPRGM